MTLVSCPICRKRFDTAESPAMPFCCEKCRLIDLGRWLDEKYGTPAEPSEDEPPPPEEPAE